MEQLITFHDVERAAERMAGHLPVTPFRESINLGRLVDRTLYLKYENLQTVGAFKERGALNKLMQLSPDEARRGVITASAGNHAQAVAYHGKRLGIPAVIVMPVPTPPIKVIRTEAFGATVIQHGNTFDEANEHALRLAEKDNLVFVHAFDDPAVVAGQGTVGLEMLAAAAPAFDTVLVPVGGGGLIAGIATVMKHLQPHIKIIGVEADLVPSMAQYLKGMPAAAPPSGIIRKEYTIADGIAVGQVASLTADIVKRHVDQLITVAESEIAHGVQLLLEVEKTLVEGAGAVGLAALLHHGDAIPGERVALVLSGGNMDIGTLAKIIDKGLVTDGRLARITVQLPDIPGSLAGATATISQCEANVREVTHHRAFDEIPIGQVMVTFVVETRSLQHVGKIKTALTEHGCLVVR